MIKRIDKKRLWVVGALILVGSAIVAVVAGCGSQPPQVLTASVTSSTAPSVSVQRAEAIQNSIYSVIHAADKNKDPAILTSRVDGPELAIRTSQLIVEKGTNKSDPATIIPPETRQRVLPLTAGWPRNIYVITSTTADQQSQRLLVFNQATPHTNYMLWGLVRLFSGAVLPKFPIPSIGAEAGTLNDVGLVETPRKAIEMYAKILNDPSSSDTQYFAEDQFRQHIAQLMKSVAQVVDPNHGSQQQIFTPDVDTAKIVRSVSGGDLVIAQINSVWTRNAGNGRTSEPASDAEKVLFGNATAGQKLKVTYVNVIALYIPPAGNGAKIQAVGAERQPVKVEVEK